MEIYKEIEKASPLEKVHMYSLLNGVRIDRSNQISKTDKEKCLFGLSTYGLERYRATLAKDLDEYNGSFRDWDQPKRNAVQRNKKNIVEDHVLEKIKGVNYLAEISARDLIECAEIVGFYLVFNGLKTNQVRKFLDGVRRIQTDVNKYPECFQSDQVVMLKVHLAYAYGRAREVEVLMHVLNLCIDRVRVQGQEGYKDFMQMVKMVESIVAYHRFYGGSD